MNKITAISNIKRRYSQRGENGWSIPVNLISFMARNNDEGEETLQINNGQKIKWCMWWNRQVCRNRCYGSEAGMGASVLCVWNRGVCICGGGVADPVGAGEIRKQLSKGKKQR